MSGKNKVKKPKPPFEEGELTERIAEAFCRAVAVPTFKEYRIGLTDLSIKQEAFVKCWIEEALRYAHSPSGNQIARAKFEEERKSQLHLSLTSAQQRELVRVFDEPFPDDRIARRTRKRIPHATFRVLHAAGLVSTTQTVTEVGSRVALNIKRLQVQSKSD
ncbi:MAG TPA: hypothetical protein VF592_05000 [Sphingomonas sp.]|uniref:hypothetical protein n=1 Tax=Sphingomonas sp. TaxID=28214 RepID=UPI002ED9B282